MSLKKQLVISIVMVIVFTFVGLSVNAQEVMALSNPYSSNFSGGNTPTTNTSNPGNDIPRNNTTGNNATGNNTAEGNLANTGLEDLPYLVITLLAVSAIFAYKKIKEYNQY